MGVKTVVGVVFVVRVVVVVVVAAVAVVLVSSSSRWQQYAVELQWWSSERKEWQWL